MHEKFDIRCRAIIFDQGELLVVRHPGNNFLALPGGHLEAGEGIKECLERELTEELGVSPEIGNLLYINKFRDGDKEEVVEFFFRVENAPDYRNLDSESATHDHEIEEIIWLTKNDAQMLRPQKVQQDFNNDDLAKNNLRYI